MEKLLQLLNLEALKGYRLKISLLVAGVLGVLNQLHVITPEQVDTIIKVGLPFGLYFAVEHWEPKKP